MTSTPARSSTSSGEARDGVGGEEPAFVCATRQAPFLTVVEPDGGQRPLPGRSVIGPARFPTVSPAGLLAYLTLPGPRHSALWLTALAVLDRDGALCDIVPGVRSQTPGSWSPDGRRLAVVRAGGPAGRWEAAVIDLADGGETTIEASDDLTGVAWVDDRTVVVCRSSEVVRVPLEAGQPETLATSPVAASLARYGTDDLYATFEQPCVGPGGVAVVTAWHAQGRSPREEVRLASGGTLSPVAGGRGTRYPRWWGAELFVSAAGGLLVSTPGRAGAAHPHVVIEGLHSGEPVRSGLVAGHPMP